MRKAPVKSMRIVVGGKGMIPRMGMIAPIKEPFEVSLNELNLILRTPSLTVKMVSPIDNHTVTINNKNYDGMLKLYTAWVAEKQHLDAVAEEEESQRKSDEAPMTESEKKEIEFAKKKGYIPAEAEPVSKSEIQEAVTSAFESLIGEPPIINPIKSPIKTINDIVDKK